MHTTSTTRTPKKIGIVMASRALAAGTEMRLMRTLRSAYGMRVRTDDGSEVHEAWEARAKLALNRLRDGADDQAIADAVAEANRYAP